MFRKKVHVVVIGAGYWGEKLIQEYLNLSVERPDVVLYAIVDIDDRRLNYLKEKYDLPSKILYKNYLEVLSDNNVDAVHIAVPNEKHYQIAMDAIEKGKNILLEKPMTTCSRTAFKLARAAEKAGLIMMVGHIFRFNNAVNMAKELVMSKKMGKIYYLTLKWVTNMQALPQTDIVFDLAPHPIDILNHLLDEWPISVFARAKSFKREKPNFEDVAFIMMEFPENIMAETTLSWIHHGIKTRSIEIVGENGTLYVDALNQKVTLYNNDVVSNLSVEKNNTIKSMIEHFLANIISGRSVAENSPLIGAMTVNVIEKIRESIIKKCFVA